MDASEKPSRVCDAEQKREETFESILSYIGTSELLIYDGPKGKEWRDRDHVRVTVELLRRKVGKVNKK